MLSLLCESEILEATTGLVRYVWELLKYIYQPRCTSWLYRDPISTVMIACHDRPMLPSFHVFCFLFFVCFLFFLFVFGFSLECSVFCSAFYTYWIRHRWALESRFGQIAMLAPFWVPKISKALLHMVLRMVPSESNQNCWAPVPFSW